MSVEIGIICAIVGMVIGYFTFQKNRDKDVKSDATKSAVIETKLDHIGQAVDAIRIDSRANEQRWAAWSERLIKVEEGNKQAHKRIDVVEERGFHNDERR